MHPTTARTGDQGPHSGLLLDIAGRGNEIAVRLRIDRWCLFYVDREAGEAYRYAREVESDINVQVLIGSSPEYVANH